MHVLEEPHDLSLDLLHFAIQTGASLYFSANVLIIAIYPVASSIEMTYASIRSRAE